MNIGVIGSGDVGKTLAAGFLKHGHKVMLGTRDPRKPEVQQWLKENPGAAAGTFAETANFGEVIVLATGGSVATAAVQLAGAGLNGKTVIDATNPIAGAPVQGVIPFFTSPNESLGEMIQAAAPQAHIVKAFNSVGLKLMVNPTFPQGPPTMFYCGNDDGAKQQTAAIIRQFGWEPLDCGGIIAARAIEPLCMLWLIPGFLRNQWTHAFKVLTL